MRLRKDFLNYRPDAEDFGNEGLTQADNVLHDSEGWRPLHLASAGAFATTGALAATTATVVSLVAKPVGNSGDLFCAWITDSSPQQLNVGINGVTATSSATGHPLAFATLVSAPQIYAFDVCELAGKIVWTVEAQGETTTPATTISVAYAGYMDY